MIAWRWTTMGTVWFMIPSQRTRQIMRRPNKKIPLKMPNHRTIKTPATTQKPITIAQKVEGFFSPSVCLYIPRPFPAKTRQITNNNKFSGNPIPNTRQWLHGWTFPLHHKLVNSFGWCQFTRQLSPQSVFWEHRKTPATAILTVKTF